MELVAACALKSNDITLKHYNKVPQVMNKAHAVSDDEDDEGFPIGEVYNTETQLDAEEDV